MVDNNHTEVVIWLGTSPLRSFDSAQEQSGATIQINFS